MAVRRPLRYLLPAIALLASATARASADVCREPASGGLLAGSLAWYGDTDTDPGGELARENVDLDFITPGERGQRLRVGAAHRYAIFDTTPEVTATNGHLHTFYTPLHLSFGADGERSLRLSIAPALSGSSNVIDNLDDFFDDALQLLAAASANFPLGGRTAMRIGLCGDYRFGEYQASPIVALDWQSGKNWRGTLGYPDSSVTWTWSAHWSTTLRAGPDGNQWAVRNRSLERGSTFRYEAWTARWRVEWQSTGGAALAFELGRQFNERIAIHSAGLPSLLLEPQASTRIGASFGWRF